MLDIPGCRRVIRDGSEWLWLPAIAWRASEGLTRDGWLLMHRCGDGELVFARELIGRE